MGKAANQRKHKEEKRKWRTEQPVDTVEQAVDFLVDHFDEETIAWLKSLPEEDANSEASRGLGMSIRNKFGLWQGNVNLLRSCGDEKMFPDAASAVIIQALLLRLRNS